MPKQKTRIIIGLGNDGAYLLSASEDVDVEIRDYDVPKDWEGDINFDEDGDKYQEAILQGERQDPIKAQFVKEVEVIDPDSNLPVHVAILKLETGGMIGVDSSYIDQEAGPIYSPFDKGVPLHLEEDEDRDDTLPPDLEMHLDPDDDYEDD